MLRCRGDSSEVGDDRDRRADRRARRRSRRRAREGRSPPGPSGAAASSPGCSTASRANEGGGSFAAQEENLVARRTALAAPCWTCAPSTPPASPQTGASRWSSRFVAIGDLDVRRRRGRRRRLGAGGRRRARARRAAVVPRLRRPLAPARRRARRASRSPGAATARASGRSPRSRARSSTLVARRRPRPPDRPRASSPACSAPRAHRRAVAGAETRYERAILLDLTVLELRFRRITDARRLLRGQTPQHCESTRRAKRIVKGSDPSSNGVPVEAEWGPGSALAPRTVTSKCRCGPVAEPVEPTRPTWAPAVTAAPTPTAIEERWA